MATLATLKDTIKKAKADLAEANKKSDSDKAYLDIRKKKKKVKRLTRKSAKLVFKEKMVEEKKKPKKERKAAEAS